MVLVREAAAEVEEGAEVRSNFVIAAQRVIGFSCRSGDCLPVHRVTG